MYCKKATKSAFPAPGFATPGDCAYGESTEFAERAFKVSQIDTSQAPIMRLPECRLGVASWLYFDTMSGNRETSRFNSKPRQLAAQLHRVGPMAGAHDAEYE